MLRPLIEMMLEKNDETYELMRCLMDDKNTKEVMFRGTKEACLKHLDFLLETATSTTAPSIE